MKWKLGITILVIAVIILLVLSGTITFLIATNSKLVKMNNEFIYMSEMSREKFRNIDGKNKIILRENGEDKEYTYEEMGIKLDFTEEELEKLSRIYVDFDSISKRYVYKEIFETQITELNKSRTEWESARFCEEESQFLIIPEKEGNKLKIEELKYYIKENIGLDILVVNLEEFIEEKPENLITAELYEDVIKDWKDFKIAYTNGFIITNEMIKPYFKYENTQIVFDESKKEALWNQCETWAREELVSYNTLGGYFNFLTHNKEMLELKGITYGGKYNSQKEAEEIYNMIMQLTPQESRKPVMDIDYNEDIQSNIIEISIEEQHLWFWRNNKVITETDVVTGRKGKHDTPHGVFQILNMIDGVYLEGSGYKSWVDKWMRIYNGYGLHDAMWRNEFGGDIYETNGSHGCINLPHDFAVELYDNVKPGDIVVIY